MADRPVLISKRHHDPVAGRPAGRPAGRRGAVAVAIQPEIVGTEGHPIDAAITQSGRADAPGGRSVPSPSYDTIVIQSCPRHPGWVYRLDARRESGGEGASQAG